ncbi:ATP cone domain-containing protein [Aureisphaera galaxeae]|uniref:restriction endonuclease n=1 Tax=Aureisphaera galaxeae TaxID=1538023 RepID=UPI002350078C|nr:restriction endonuclease [Aureisphaera galaxeae]MDC8003780.1 ATP cone domain-containing protein [Aureisphaera galaxeae]
MEPHDIEIIKSSGEKGQFSFEKLRKSLQRSGADHETVEGIIDVVRDELYQGISTKEIYHRAFSLLKKKKSSYASRYKLKRAIYELGPTGFPFERFVAAILYYSGYDTSVNIFVPGKCVTHEVDIVAKKNGQTTLVECKFHGDPGNKSDVKVPLYINSRYQDILLSFKGHGEDKAPSECWVVTNTRFTKDARTYGNCAGLQLISWDYPENDGLKDRIDRLGLYPITVSTLLTKREKQFLLSRDVVLCRQLINDHFYLDHLGISESRKQRILDEVKLLCTIH